jgi:hypothetical protein
MQQMRAAQRYVFYCVIPLYAAYNCFWVTGTMFSFGKSDTKGELIFVVLTFLADIPVLWWTRTNVKLGSIFTLVILIASVWLAESHGVLNGITLLYWYGPKLVPWLVAVWAGRPERQVVPRVSR